MNNSCQGTCGAIADDWIVDEINAQISGWKGGNKSIYEYLRWANGNQRYKDADFFQFSKGTSCGTWTAGAHAGCGSSVTLCGICVRSAILGNLIYGMIASNAGFSLSDTTDAPSDVKYTFLMTVSPNDHYSYLAGHGMGAGLPSKITLDEVCERLKLVSDAIPSALKETNKSGGENDLSTCVPCNEKTKETRHGGGEKPMIFP